MGNSAGRPPNQKSSNAVIGLRGSGDLGRRSFFGRTLISIYLDIAAGESSSGPLSYSKRFQAKADLGVEGGTLGLGKFEDQSYFVGAALATTDVNLNDFLIYFNCF